MKKLLIGALLFLLLSSLNTESALARIGVGVNTGKIHVDEVLKAGIIYKLPSVTVINTGDEPSEYEVGIAYHQDQPELAPNKDWFSFSPEKFHLEPKAAQAVEITLNLPLKVEPGNYFAYLEGRPLKKTEQGTASIGVAAAAQLYFTVEPANIFYALYYRIKSVFEVYAPWPQRIMIGLVIVGVLAAFKRFFNVQINLKKEATASVPRSDNSTEKIDE